MTSHDDSCSYMKGSIEQDPSQKSEDEPVKLEKNQILGGIQFYLEKKVGGDQRRSASEQPNTYARNNIVVQRSVSQQPSESRSPSMMDTVAKNIIKKIERKNAMMEGQSSQSAHKGFRLPKISIGSLGGSVGRAPSHTQSSLGNMPPSMRADLNAGSMATKAHMHHKKRSPSKCVHNHDHSIKKNKQMATLEKQLDAIVPPKKRPNNKKETRPQPKLTQKDQSRSKVKNLLVDCVERCLIAEARDALIAKKEKEKEARQQLGSEENFNFSKIKTSDEYLDHVSHQIPISELYQLISCMCNSEENEFCAVLIKIECMELQNQYRGRFLLQVWTKTGLMVYQRILQYPTHRWNLNGKYLIFVQNEKEPTDFREWQQIFVVRLSSNVDKKPCQQAMLNTQSQFQFYAPLHAGKYNKPSTENDDIEFNLDTFLGFTEQKVGKGQNKLNAGNPILLVSNSTHLKYVQVPEEVFSTSEPFILPDTEIVGFKKDVRVLAIAEIEKGYPCLITELQSGHMIFLQLDIINDVLELRELNDKGVDSQKNEEYDPIVKIISTIFLDDASNDFRQCGLALHESGSLDFLWNFRVVDQHKVTSPLFIGGIVEDIYADFDFVYYKITEFEEGEGQKVLRELKRKDANLHKSVLRVFNQSINEASPHRVAQAREFIKTMPTKQTMYRCCNQWKMRIGSSTAFPWAPEAIVDIQKLQKNILHHQVANFVRIYPWFSNMQTHFAITHNKFLSIFDINSQQWDHVVMLQESGKDDYCLGGLRVQNNRDKEGNPQDGAYYAGVILKSGRILFYRAETAARVKTDWPDANLHGEILNVVRDKRHQQFILLLVRQKRGHGLTLPGRSPIISQKGTKSEHKLVLYIYTEKHYETLLDVPESELEEDSGLFIIPAAKLGESSFLVIDNVLNRESKFYEIYFEEDHLPPQISPCEDISFKRTYNTSFGEQGNNRNKLVGFIQQPLEANKENHMSIFVSKNDISLQHVVNKPKIPKENDKPTISFKHFTDRSIQAILSLDSWMYTLSNTCPSIKLKSKEQMKEEQKKNKNKEAQIKKTEPEYGRRWFGKDGVATAKPPRFGPFKNASLREKMKEMLMRKSKDFSPCLQNYTGETMDTQGLYAYDLKRLANTQTLVSYKLKDAMVGVNNHIDFCNNSYRIAFLKDFNTIELVPVPHRNTINFLGMKRKSQFLIWREVSGVFTALDAKGVLRAWVIGTGKTTKPSVTVGNIELEEFELYECNEYDSTYKRDWQQHPKLSVSLLKSKKELLYYDAEADHLLAENQPATFAQLMDRIKPQVFMFKVITMSDNVVKEEMSFTFDYLVNQCNNEEDMQRLILSRDLNKLMEITQDSRCKIYTKIQQEGRKRVEWQLLHQINKYPTPLQGSSYVNFLFSPRFNHFLDVTVNTTQFCIKSCATNKTVLKISKHLFGFKQQPSCEKDTIRALASRVQFISEDKIRVINKYGLDTIIKLNFDAKDEFETTTIKSVCRIDHWNQSYCEDAHTILEPVPLDSHMTIERLLRKSQRFKSFQYHLKAQLEQEQALIKLKGSAARTPLDEDEEFAWIDMNLTMQEYYSLKLHQKLQSVDYTQEWAKEESQFVAEMSFTILDWQIIERMTNDSDIGFTIDSIDRTRILQLCFNILPGVQTVVHKLVDACNNVADIQGLFQYTNNYLLSELTEQLWKKDSLQRLNSKVQYCTVPILEDIGGETALDYAFKDLENVQRNVANQILTGIEKYPFMHSGFTLVSGVLKSLQFRCPASGYFLDSRMVVSEHLDCTSLQRQCLNGDKMLPHADESGCNYVTWVANPWENKKTLINNMFETKFARKISLKYLDVPGLYTFSKQGNQFFEILNDYEETELFKHRSIQIIIMCKWLQLKNRMLYWQFIPHMTMLFLHLLWHVNVRPYRTTNIESEKHNLLLMAMLFMVVSYFLFVEILQMRADFEDYIKGVAWNVVDCLPLFTIYFQIILAIMFEEGQDEELLGWVLPLINTGSILMLWSKIIYYLRIFEDTNYLAGMVVKVISEMRCFLMVYFMSHVAFGQGFYRLSSACGGEHAFTSRPENFVFMQSFFFSFMLSIGEFSYSNWSNDGVEVGFKNPNFHLIWVLYLISVTLNNIILLNLLIAIINETYGNIRDRAHEVAFQERVEAISTYQKIMPESWTRGTTDEEELLTCTKLLLVAEEQEETDANLGDASTKDIAEKKILKKLDTCKENVKDIKTDCDFIEVQMKTGNGIVNKMTASLRQNSKMFQKKPLNQQFTTITEESSDFMDDCE